MVEWFIIRFFFFFCDCFIADLENLINMFLPYYRPKSQRVWIYIMSRDLLPTSDFFFFFTIDNTKMINLTLTNQSIS